jgi:hypothetical protein
MTKTVEEIREYHRKYYQEHKQKMLAQAKKWREENADRVIANRIYYSTHHRMKEYYHKYYLKNRERILENSRKKRAKKALGGNIEPINKYE